MPVSAIIWPKGRVLNRIAAAVFLLSATPASAAILCQDAPGRGDGVHWWWRDIDGRRCWFKREGAIPAKSEFRWDKEKAREKTAKTGEGTMKAEAASPPAEQDGWSVRLLKTRIRWEGMSEVEANWIDGDAPVDLMVGDLISGPAGLGGSWVIPSHRENIGETTSFAARFAPIIETRKAQANMAGTSGARDGTSTD